MSEKIIVLKFGSSVLTTEADLPNAIHEIYRWVRNGYHVVAVVSAIGNATDSLIAQAQMLSSNPESFATAELLATGERAAAALLGVTLDRAGVSSRVLNPREIGLTVSGSPLDSELVSVDVARLRALHIEYSVLVVPGFFGTDVFGRTHLLGRGGSDLSAAFLATNLGGQCRLIKDVDGIYESDPADASARPKRFKQLSFADALRVGGPIIQPKAVAFLSKHDSRVEVAALAMPYESIVCSDSTQIASAIPIRPLRVLLMGLGTVGFGVYQRLLANADQFEVVGCLVRDCVKYEALGVPSALLFTERQHVSAVQSDIVVDALPGETPSRDLVRHFLSRGTHAVSANKALIAAIGTSLAAIAARHGAMLRYSAAVGGSTPMIETIVTGTKCPIVGIAAVLNGTCNFVLDACGGGATLAAAVAEATAQGFAEADATEDLSGRDAERKLRILCRHAFRAEPETIEVDCFEETVARRAREAAQAGSRLRQIARATRELDGIHAHVRFERVAPDSLFGRLSREWNAFEAVDSRGGKKCATGRGAGRWPTTEAITADLFDIQRELFANRVADA